MTCKPNFTFTLVLLSNLRGCDFTRPMRNYYAYSSRLFTGAPVCARIK